MGWIKAIAEALNIVGMVLNWFKEKSDDKKKEKGKVLGEIFNADKKPDQRAMQKLINRFNSVDR